jgi:peptidoglycan/LPS O-acetylase OafA/YrhL
VHLTLASLILGKDFLDRANPTIRFVADSSYWVYIMHLPALFFIQYLLLDVNLNLWLELFISTGGTLALGMLTYVLLIRWTPIGWMLNGRRTKAEAAQTVAV